MSKEVRVDFIYEKLAEWFDAPCNFSYTDIGDVDDYMWEHCKDWCENNCDKSDAKYCWQKLFEEMAE